MTTHSYVRAGLIACAVSARENGASGKAGGVTPGEFSDTPKNEQVNVERP